MDTVSDGAGLVFCGKPRSGRVTDWGLGSNCWCLDGRGCILGVKIDDYVSISRNPPFMLEEEGNVENV